MNAEDKTFIQFAERAGYRVEYVNGTGAPVIASFGQFEGEHPRAVWLYAAAMEGDSICEETLGEGAWRALVKTEAGRVFEVGQDEQGNVESGFQIPDSEVARHVADMEARQELRGYLEEPEHARAEGVPFVADPSELSGQESSVAVFVNDHGNASLMVRDESGDWSERASFV
jgi:hypothetical protein